MIDILEETRANALAQALLIINDASTLGSDEDKGHRLVVMGGVLALLHMVLEDYFPPEEVKALLPHIVALQAVLAHLRALDAVRQDPYARDN